MKWGRLARVRKKIKTQCQNPPRETTTRRLGELLVVEEEVVVQSDLRVIP